MRVCSRPFPELPRGRPPMFDNIIGNRMTVIRLEREIRTGTLAHSILFTGNDYTGKLTTALETARALNCTEDGKWDCGCRSCSESRYLGNPYLFLTGPYAGFYEIRLTAELLKKRDHYAGRLKLIRAVRKLTLRFDRRFLPEDDLKKISGELLTELYTGIERIAGARFVSEEERIGIIDSVSAAAEKLSSAVPSSFSVNAVRNLSSAAYAGVDGKKVIIIENADALSVAAANALLKILEEPPSDTYFILTAVRQNAVLPTVLSRLSVFSFSDRTEEEEALLLKLFYENEEPISLYDFILKHSGWDIDTLNRSVDSFFEMLGSETGVGEFYRSSLTKWQDKSLFVLFWEKVSRTIQSRFAGGAEGNPYKQQLYAGIQHILNEGKTALNEAHQAPESVIETSFFKIREILERGRRA